MTTLAILKARIADDLMRSDLTTQIASAITDAITAWQSEAFYFNKGRTVSFTTVSGQWDYDSGDDADIGNILSIDDMQVLYSGRSLRVFPKPQDIIELWTDQGTSTSREVPRHFSYTDSTLYFYPIPDGAYVIRVIGTMKVAAPASDGEANNKWMTEAFELIRARAKIYLGLYTLYDDDLVQRSTAAEPKFGA